MIFEALEELFPTFGPIRRPAGWRFIDFGAHLLKDILL
jgi:hypothetical protein